MKDLIIIGAGPAGLTSAIYGIRAGLETLVLERFSPGGQVLNTAVVENYPGFAEPVHGWELMTAMENQVKRLGAEIRNGEVSAVEKGDVFSVVLADRSIVKAKTVIIASGASYKKLDVPGEAELTGKGVSYCATCDGAFYKDRITAVVGGGDTALEEACFLTRFASKVYLIHRRDEFRGAKILQDRVFANNKIEPVYNTVVTSINGKNKVESATLKNKRTGEEKNLQVDGVFLFVGIIANTGYLPEKILNERGEVIVDKNMQTGIPGLFAAGDLREGSRRQIVMAASDGATAALSAYDYIQGIHY